MAYKRNKQFIAEQMKTLGLPKEGFAIIEITGFEDNEDKHRFELTAKVIPPHDKITGDGVEFEWKQSYVGKSEYWANVILNCLAPEETKGGKLKLHTAIGMKRKVNISHWEGYDGQTKVNVYFIADDHGRRPAPITDEELKWLNEDDFDPRYLPDPDTADDTHHTI
jgi:hypothetical protein